MRVAFITPYYHPEVEFGGPPKRLHTMARALRDCGWEVAVVTFDTRSRGRKDLATHDGIEVQYLPWIGRALNALPTSVRALRKQVASADVVHCFALYNFICPLAVRFASRLTKPVLLEPMGMYVPRVRTVALKRVYNDTFTKWMAKRTAGIVATSEIEKRELGSLACLAPVFVRRNGIDVEEFAVLPRRSVMRERWGIPPEAKLVLYLGRISEKKQLVHLVSAFEAANVSSSKLVIAGPVSEPGYAERLRDGIANSTRRDDILLVGGLFDDDLKAAFSAADLFVLPSLNENFGNAAAEAVAAGVPVLLTETCGIAPMIHGRAGMAVGLGVGHLANGICEMLKSELRSQMTAKMDQVKRELSWDEPIAQTVALYEQLLGRRIA